MHLIYDGIEMKMLEIEDYLWEPCYDDTGCVYLYDRVTITGTFYINGQQEVAAVTPVTSCDVNTGASETLQALWRRTAPPGAAAALPVPGGPPGINNNSSGHVGTDGGGPFPFIGQGGVYATSTQNQNVDFVFTRVVPAVNTEAVIRSRLSAPRGRLFVFTGNGNPARRDEMLLMAPSRWDAHCDAKLGPFPKLRQVTAFHGDGLTFQVRFSVEAFVNEQKSEITDDGDAKNTRTQSPLLSNRFRRRQSVDADGYTTTVTEGTAIFNAELLYNSNPRNPDQFRLSMFQPVPFGTIRGDIEIETIPDGSGVHYSYTDVQQRANFVAGPFAEATQIQAVHRQALVADSDVLDGALTAYERVLRIRADKSIGKGTSPTGASPPPAPPPRGLRGLGTP